MKYRWMVACALALLGAPTGLAAQQQQRGAQGQGPDLAEVMKAVQLGLSMLDEGNVQYLLARDKELELTDDQHAKMREIALGWLRATRASRDTLRAVMKTDPQTMRGMQQQDMFGRMQQLMPHGMLLVQEDRKALEEAFSLLRPAQQTKARALLQQRLDGAKQSIRSGG
jgi:hypothetical protein